MAGLHNCHHMGPRISFTPCHGADTQAKPTTCLVAGRGDYVTHTVLVGLAAAYDASCGGNSKVTSFPVSFLYTPEKVSSLYSVVLRSLGSRNTCTTKTQPVGWGWYEREESR